MVCCIGRLKLKNRFFLAPMLEPNDIAFRLLCRRAGCGLTYTGMTSPLSKQKLFLDDRPALQLFGNSEKGIKVFMKKYDKMVSLWDFNLGCPSTMSKKFGHGAFMHDDFKMIDEIFMIMRSSTKKPCTVKLRKSKNAINIAKLAEKNGFDAVCIHPRTVSQGYSGEVDYDFALKLKKGLNIPVIYSGNVNVGNVNKILKDFDFVMLGREAIGNPGVFSKLLGCEKKIGFKDYLKLAKKYKIFFRQIKYQAMNFTKGAKGAKEMRKKLVDAKAVGDVEKIMK